MNSFGQEFYPLDSIRALKFADKTRLNDRAALVNHIAAMLPQPGETTRRRIAGKLVQRYLRANGDRIEPAPHEQPFVRLVARSRQAATQIELLYLQLANVDTLVGSLARDLFYPVCISGQPPQGMAAAEFMTRNGGLLLTTAPLLTRFFIIEQAQRAWKFGDGSSIDRALRVLQGAGLIAGERMRELRRHPMAFRMSQHDVSLTTFVWALYDEVVDQAGSLPQDQVATTTFARTLLLTPAQVNDHLDAAARQQLLAHTGPAAHRSIRLTLPNRNALVDALLEKAL